MRLRRPIPALPAVAVATMALLAAVFVPLLPTYAQGNAGPCSNGTAVPDPANNPGLVSDCEALLSARGSLDPGGSLNWSAATPIVQWDGVRLGSAPQRVVALDLSNRPLTGRIPAELGSLSKLEGLHLYDSRLSGGIPVELGNLSDLVELVLGSNQLSGPIPTELASLSNLTRIELHYNRLEGKIPAELGGLSDLTELSLGQNHLSGEIPPELADLANLRELSLSNNRLTGEILPELGGLSNLTELRLGGNQLSGHIPLELTNLSNLKRLHLDHSQLSGEIPHTLDRLSNLIDLRLSDNELTGQIPSELGNLGSLTVLSLERNRLSGPIPTVLGNLARLKILDLEENRLSGPIPPELGRLLNLHWLILGNNRLSGPIPTELGNLSNLTVLKLSGNDLSGEIPAELEHLTNLTLLWLAHRRLEGCVPGRLRSVENNDVRYLGLPFCDVLPDDLVVSPGSLEPSFDPYRTDYIAKVTGSIVTILAVSIGDATFRVLEADDREVADADGTMPGIQIEIGAGTEITGRVVSADGEAARTYTIEIRRVLGSPAIAAVEAGGGYLAVSWAAPDEFAAARTASYDLRYIPTAADESVDARWTVVTNVPTYTADGSLQYTITGLSAGTQYEVQVRAVNRSGEPVAWSASVTGTPTTPSVCVTGGAVTGAINPGIVSDCESLLAARDALAGTGRLNWSASTAIKDWDGVTVGGTPPRVVGLSVNSRGLNGTIPAELGDLTGLRRLHLFENRLTGPIPAELGGLADLQSLDIGDNRLTGQIPLGLARLSNLLSLDLSDNELAGVIPSQLGDLDNLVEVDLSGNDLRGCTPPTANADDGPSCFADEGMTLTLDTSYLLRDDQLRVTSVGDASNGVVTLDGTTVTYRHDGSETTTGGFSYTASDGARTVTSLVTITVSPVNDPPAGETDALTVQEGGTVSVEARELLANDTDAEGDALDITAVGDASNGLVALDGSTIIYRHDGSETNAVSFKYTVSDSIDSTSVLVTIAVSPVNDPPVGVDDALAVEEGGMVSVQAELLTANDTDPDLDTLRITAVGDATNGLVTLDGTTIIYRHDGSETNAGSFTYTLTDGTESVTASVTITVSPVNDPPTGVDDALAVEEGGMVTVQAQRLLDNDSDAEGDTLSITAVGDANNGLVTLDGNTIFYRHDGSETNADNFTYTVSDGTDSTTAFVTITVSPVNDPPVGVDDALAVEEGGTVSVQAELLTANDTDPDLDTLRITAVRDATNGLVTLDGSTIIYRHDGSETNAGNFTYTVSDGTDSTTAFVTITVSPVNDPPTGVDDALAVREGGTVSVASLQLLANDTDAEGDALRISAVGGAVNGLVTLDGNTIAYTHDGSETVTGSFTYTVGDGTDSTTAFVTITVSPINDPPTGVDDALAVREDGTVSVAAQQLLANDTDAEGDALRITAVGGANNGLVTLDGSTIAYTHDGSETLTGNFTYTVSDGTDSTTAFVTITVSPINDPPVGIGDALAVREGGTVSVAALQLLANDTDAEGDALRISAVGDAINGVVTLDGNTIAYTHDGSETLTGSFTYTVADRTGSATVLVTVTVSPVDDTPVLLLVTVALGAGLLVVGGLAALAVSRARRAA